MLLLAGLFEIGFAVALKASDGFARLVPTAIFAACAFISFSLLSRAAQVIPIGTAYAVWTGIGAAGTAIIGIVAFREGADPWRLFFIFTLIASVVGLNLVSSK
ncbi:MAG: multidrug efflux SMR transporter [Pseudomonadota bacterium]